MSNVLDDLVVAALLLASILYALAALGPRSWKLRMLKATSALLARAPSFTGLAKLAQRLSTASTADASGECGGCESCGAEAPGGSKASAAEINIPVTEIGRRITR